MNRPKILITNASRDGKVYEPAAWYARVGKAAKKFSQAEWEQGGIQWINDTLAGKP